jgi:hypothetical protein
LIVGKVEAGRPQVQATIRIPRLRLQSEITFLVDTGSTTTLIHPRDWEALGVLDSDFAGSEMVRSTGIGGRTENPIEVCDLFLHHEDGFWDRLYLNLRFARPTQTNKRLPSLLGRDIIANYRLVFESTSGLLSLDLPSSKLVAGDDGERFPEAPF